MYVGYTRLILFSNSEPPRLRDVVSHLITIETTINTHIRVFAQIVGPVSEHVIQPQF